jgi:4'-phosphopantetheinyl transferase EntD
VAVCVVNQANYAGIGIDIEAVRRVTDDIETRILTPEEIGDTTVPDARTVRFACKEAVYKAVNPIIGEFFGFQAVRIDLDALSGSFRGEPMHDGPFAEHVASGRGVFVAWRGHHLAGFYVAQ